jgi:superfamily II DNA or RNA helicase
MSAAPTLRTYQTDMLRAISQARAAGQNRLLCKAPTGTGKTVTFAAMWQWPDLASWMQSFPRGTRRMLVIAHREELLDQAADKILKQNPEASVSIEQADRYASPAADIVIASIQTLAASKFRRLHRLLQRGPFRLVIVDEAHHAAAATYRTALVHLGFLPPAEGSDAENIEAANYDDVALMSQALRGWDATAPKDRLLVGVTATPNRSDAIGLGCVFQSIAYSYNLKDAIGDKYLVPIVPWVIETKSVLDDVRTTAGDFNQKQLAAAVNNAIRNDLAVAAWQEHASDRSTLAFTVDVAHAHALAKAFQQAGVAAEALSARHRASCGATCCGATPPATCSSSRIAWCSPRAPTCRAPAASCTRSRRRARRSTSR